MFGYTAQFAQPGWGRQVSGTKDAPQRGPKYGMYVKTTINGNDTTIYDGNGLGICRYDFSHDHCGWQPHAHEYAWVKHNGKWYPNKKYNRVYPFEL